MKYVNYILNVISTGMNDDHISFLESSRSDVVYNFICGGTQMAADFELIICRDLTPIHMLNHGISKDHCFFFWWRVSKTIFINRIFIFSQFNLETVIIYRLVFTNIWRSTSIDRTTLATLNILNGHMMILMVSKLIIVFQ